MTAAEFFLVQHGRLHAADVGGPGSMWDRVAGGLTDDQTRRRPPGMNSLAWLVWHTARTEDVVINLVVTDGRQVFDGTWAKRLGVARGDIGTGMTDAEVDDLGVGLDLPAARAYRTAVGRRTREVVTALPAAAWSETVTAVDVGRAVTAGAFGPNAAWVEKIWAGVSRANRLGATAIAHNAMHLGEAVAIRGQLGLPVGM
ncbi:MAG TPA: DinB family protein [Methylomirabilota bacterium]